MNTFIDDYFDELILHVEADVASSSEFFDILNEYKERIEKLRESKLPDKLLTGKDLIQLGLKPSEQFGEILNEMYDAQLNGEFNTKEKAIEYFLNNGQKYGVEYLK